MFLPRTILYLEKSTEISFRHRPLGITRFRVPVHLLHFRPVTFAARLFTVLFATPVTGP